MHQCGMVIVMMHDVRDGLVPEIIGLAKHKPLFDPPTG
jgi:hypothetical protein